MPPVSVYDAPPLESGGPTARTGFDFQDYYAVNAILKMILGNHVKEVWCELDDDITLICQDSNGIYAEFVQVKRRQLNQLWSIAKLCENDDTGECLVIKSLNHDRVLEPARFRIVATRETMNNLGFLRHEVGSGPRTLLSLDEEAAAAELLKVLPGEASSNGHRADFWIRNTCWEHWQDQERLQDESLLLIHQYAETTHENLFVDQAEELHQRLLGLVREKSALSTTERASKRLARQDMQTWINERIAQAQAPTSTEGGLLLAQKMEKAQIAEDLVVNAKMSRMRYRTERVQPKYRNAGKAAQAEGEVRAHLLELKAQLDAGLIPDDGGQFHARCLAEVKALQKELVQDGVPTLEFLQGSMYDITDRCLHRFIKVAQ